MASSQPQPRVENLSLRVRLGPDRKRRGARRCIVNDEAHANDALLDQPEVEKLTVGGDALLHLLRRGAR